MTDIRFTPGARWRLLTHTHPEFRSAAVIHSLLIDVEVAKQVISVIAGNSEVCSLSTSISRIFPYCIFLLLCFTFSFTRHGPFALTSHTKAL